MSVEHPGPQQHRIMHQPRDYFYEVAPNGKKYPMSANAVLESFGYDPNAEVPDLTPLSTEGSPGVVSPNGISNPAGSQEGADIEASESFPSEEDARSSVATAISEHSAATSGEDSGSSSESSVKNSGNSNNDNKPKSSSESKGGNGGKSESKSGGGKSKSGKSTSKSGGGKSKSGKSTSKSGGGKSKSGKSTSKSGGGSSKNKNKTGKSNSGGNKQKIEINFPAGTTITSPGAAPSTEHAPTGTSASSSAESNPGSPNQAVIDRLQEQINELKNNVNGGSSNEGSGNGSSESGSGSNQESAAEAQQLREQLRQERVARARQEMETATENRDRLRDAYAALIAKQENGSIGRMNGDSTRVSRFFQRVKDRLGRSNPNKHEAMDAQIADAKTAFDQAHIDAAGRAAAFMRIDAQARGEDINSQQYMQWERSAGIYGHIQELRDLNASIHGAQINAENSDYGKTGLGARLSRRVAGTWSRRGRFVHTVMAGGTGAGVGLGTTAAITGLTTFGIGVPPVALAGFAARRAGRGMANAVNRNFAGTEAGIAAREEQTEYQALRLQNEYSQIYNHGVPMQNAAQYADRMLHSNRTEDHANEVVNANRLRVDRAGRVAGIGAVATLNAGTIFDGARGAVNMARGVDVGSIVDGARDAAGSVRGIDIPGIDVHGTFNSTDGISVGVRGDGTSLSLPNIPNPLQAIQNIDIPGYDAFLDRDPNSRFGFEAGLRPDEVTPSIPSGTGESLVGDNSAAFDGGSLTPTGEVAEVIDIVPTDIDPGDGISNIADELVNLNSEFDLTPEQSFKAYQAIIESGIDPDKILINPDTGAYYPTYQIPSGPYAGQYGISAKHGKVVFSPEANAGFLNYIESLRQANELVELPAAS